MRRQLVARHKGPVDEDGEAENDQSAAHSERHSKLARGSTPAPAFSTYLLGGGFLVTALLVWSWAERRS